MNRTLLLVVAAFPVALAPLAPAQAPTIRTVTGVGVLSGTDHAFIPANTIIGQSETRAVGGTYFGSTARARVTVEPDGARGVRLTGSGYAYQPFGLTLPVTAATTDGQPRPTAYAVELGLAGARRGNVVVDIRGSFSSLAFQPGDGLTVDVTVGATTIRADLRNGQPVLQAVAVNVSQGLSVGITVRGSGTSSLSRTVSFGYEARVWFDAGAVPPADITGFAAPCSAPNHPLLFARDVPDGSRHRFHFEARALRDRPAALIFGTTTAQVPIPGTSCSLALDPVTWLVASPSIFQVATFDLVVPGPVPTATIYTQALVLDPPNYASSNGLRIDFP